MNSIGLGIISHTIVAQQIAVAASSRARSRREYAHYFLQRKCGLAEKNVVKASAGKDHGF
jgi:hypothetical protein